MRKTLIAMALLLIAGTNVKADLLFTFSGEVEDITYNNVSIDTPHPFAEEQSVYAQFQLLDDVLPPPLLPRYTNAFIQFESDGGENTLRGLYDPLYNLRIDASGTVHNVHFCCYIPSFTYEGVTYNRAPGENMEAIFRDLSGSADTFIAHYLPTGGTNVNVTATGFGTWTMETVQAIPEPSAIAIFGTGLLALGIGNIVRRHSKPKRLAS